MPKIYIDTDELYPYYFLSGSDYGDEVELTEAEIQYCKDSEEAFGKWQEFLYDKANIRKEKLKELKRTEEYQMKVKQLLNAELDAMRFKNEIKL